MIINATHIGKNLDGIGRFSLYIVKYFLGLGKYNIIINADAKIHFSDDELSKLIILPDSISPNYGFKAHLKRLFYSQKIYSPLFTLSQMEISFFNKNQIVVVHDIIPLLFPKLHKKQYAFFKYILPYVLKKVKKIIVPSYHTKELLIKYYSLNESKIEVIYNGIKLPDGNDFYQKENYILFVGRDAFTKNIDNLVLAFNKLNKKFPNLRLKLVGVVRKFDNKNVESLGFVSDRELDILYKKAKIFVLPSLYEGFGYPVIEAMVRKTAVVCSNVASLPEITNNNALYFNPYEVNDIQKAIELLLIDEKLRKRLEDSGYKFAKKFDINITLKNYERVLYENCFSS